MRERATMAGRLRSPGRGIPLYDTDRPPDRERGDRHLLWHPTCAIEERRARALTIWQG